MCLCIVSIYLRGKREGMKKERKDNAKRNELDSVVFMVSFWLFCHFAICSICDSDEEVRSLMASVTQHDDLDFEEVRQNKAKSKKTQQRIS